METCQQFIKRKKEELSKNKLISFKDIGRKGKHYFLKEASTLIPQYNLKEKVFVLERLKKIEHKGKIIHTNSSLPGSIEYRIGYFMIGKNGNKKGKWTWGQYCPVIPSRDLNQLLKKAKKEGTI